MGKYSKSCADDTNSYSNNSDITNTTLFTPHQLAEYLQINYRKVLDLIALGKLEAYRFERQIRVSEKQLQKYLDSNLIENPW